MCCKFPVLIVWGCEDEVFDVIIFVTCFKVLLLYVEGFYLVIGCYFL